MNSQISKMKLIGELWRKILLTIKDCIHHLLQAKLLPISEVCSGRITGPFVRLKNNMCWRALQIMIQ